MLQAFRVAVHHHPLHLALSTVASRGYLTATLPLQQQAAGKKKAPAAAASAAPVEKFDLTKQIPVNLLKEGEEPVYKPDSEYPPWLWKIIEEPPLVDDLLMRGVENLSLEELKRVTRVSSKKRIKASNAVSEKQKGE